MPLCALRAPASGASGPAVLLLQESGVRAHPAQGRNRTVCFRQIVAGGRIPNEPIRAPSAFVCRWRAGSAGISGSSGRRRGLAGGRFRRLRNFRPRGKFRRKAGGSGSSGSSGTPRAAGSSGLCLAGRACPEFPAAPDASGRNRRDRLIRKIMREREQGDPYDLERLSILAI